MPNGKPGDHPFTDMMLHGKRVYSAKADELIRGVAKLSDTAGTKQLADMLFSEFNTHDSPDVPRLEQLLEQELDRLRIAARERDRETE
jgi:hypothetical protein